MLVPGLQGPVAEVSLNLRSFQTKFSDSPRDNYLSSISQPYKITLLLILEIYYHPYIRRTDTPSYRNGWTHLRRHLAQKNFCNMLQMRCKKVATHCECVVNSVLFATRCKCHPEASIIKQTTYIRTIRDIRTG